MANSNENSALVSLLRDVQSPELGRRRAAEAQLTNAEHDNFPEYLRALTLLLATENDDTVRQLAGLLVKNAVSGVDMKIDCLKRQKWLEVPPQVANEIKMALIATLDSPCLMARNSASQAISKIARVEIPCGHWPDLVPTLEMLSQPGGQIHRRVGAYQVIGYFCEDVQSLREEIGREILEPQMKEVLLKCLSMGLVDSNLDIRLAALKAFYYGVYFAEQFMALENERMAIFKVLCQCLTTGREDVELAAWEVWLQFGAEFYVELGSAMQDLHNVSLGRIAQSRDNPRTALSSIEFWSTLCDEEILIMEGDSQRTSNHYIQTFQHTLLPVLYDACTRHEHEDHDEDEWTVAMAAGTSIGLCAQILKDEILSSALKFIEENFGSESWERREAAVLVYGSILEGPSPYAFSDLLKRSFEPLCNGIKDESKAVRDTTAWTVGRLAKFHYSAIIPYLEPQKTPGLIALLLTSLADEPRVASNICFALYEICAGINNEPFPGPGSRIDPYFNTIADALVGVAKRPDANEHRLRNAAHHALYMLVKQVGDGGPQQESMKILMNQLMEWMESTLQQPVSEDISEMQGPMCGCLNALIGRLDKNVLLQADQLYSLFERTVQYQARQTTSGHTQWNTAAEEALLALNKLISVMGPNFVRYMSNFYHLMHLVLQSKEDSDFVAIAIDVIGNLATSMGEEFGNCVQVFAPELFTVLKDSNTPIVLKPKAITALGDIAVMAPQAFLPFLKDFMEILHHAAGARINQGPVDSDEWVKYINDLRDATMTSYITVIYSIRDVSAPSTAGGQYPQGEPTPQQLLESEVHVMLELATVVLSEPKPGHSNIKNSLNLITDLVSHFRTTLISHIRTLPLGRILRDRSQTAEDPELKKLFFHLNEVCQRPFS